MVAAPADHWVHEYHNYDVLKDQTNPYMGESSLFPCSRKEADCVCLGFCHPDTCSHIKSGRDV